MAVGLGFGITHSESADGASMSEDSYPIIAEG